MPLRSSQAALAQLNWVLALVVGAADAACRPAERQGAAQGRCGDNPLDHVFSGVFRGRNSGISTTVVRRGERDVWRLSGNCYLVVGEKEPDHRAFDGA